ncbi:related to PUS1-pseudouridine synthase 1 [Sporisorium reilianum f. sp. reilianum]|uniref:Related to PUS1-pseudouridine synthase 1 n=1 Tax=Sporisorium reilianum f. sp. reilianum TaxID=72559 RepID=A0A2N8UMW6_9BASI|nr:related to PUS1-pseudouridine synthase 1 [Sporisorium reilianum f. sp. reilianum]
MTERLEQEVGAAATGADPRSLKREFDSEPATVDTTAQNSAPAQAEASTPKRARFDDAKEKWERRDRRGTGRVPDDTSSSADPSSSTGGDRLPKRKVAVKFGYCGIGYSGLQINPGVKTIEGDIFQAFCTAGAVSADNAVNPNKVGLQRAARTDRGVHAAGNLLSLKLILQPDGLQEGETLVDRVNALLPEFIRVWGVTRVQNGFSARQSCDSRMYEYLLPTYVFVPPKPGSTMHDMLVRMRDDELAKTGATTLGDVVDHAFWKQHGTTHDFSTDMRAKTAFRLSASALARIRSIFARYLGSHNFHNFTVGKEFRDRSCQRFMKQLTISDPTVIGETEWVSIKFHGQSFMLHQIRKMIGLLVLVGRTGAGEGLVDECFGPARVHIPKAPGLGLLLEQPIFDAYNTRIRNNNDKIAKLMRKKASSDQKDSAPESAHRDAGRNSTLHDELRESISYAPHAAAMQQFKQQWIYDRIHSTEQDTYEFGKWLNYLDVFQGPDFEFLNPKGVIPPQCIVKVGEFHRDNLRRARESQLGGKEGGGSEQQRQQQQDDDDDDEDHEAYSKKGAELDEYEG